MDRVSLCKSKPRTSGCIWQDKKLLPVALSRSKKIGIDVVDLLARHFVFFRQKICPADTFRLSGAVSK